jgi:Gpi18-like mannosyltransferase
MENKKDIFKQLVLTSLAWRMFLFLPFFITLGFLSVQNNYLGGGMQNYLHLPYIWGWANFDGEHYLSIAKIGYLPLQYFFFPVYPLLIRIVASIFSESLFGYLVSGLLVSHVSFFIALIGLRKLLFLDYKLKTINFIFLCVLLFPTSFYFVGVYTESLFLCLVIWTFYFARTGRWWIVCLLGILATATRLIGIVLIPALLFEWFAQYKGKLSRQSTLSIVYLGLVSLGLLSYMYYLHKSTGDPLYFVHNVNIFGDQRSNHLIFLPQVFYRYIFKVVPHLTFSYFPVVFTSVLEFFIGVLFFLLSIFSIRKLRPSYTIYLVGGYLIPSLAGSFSSMPRYVLVLFPGFIVMGSIIERLPKPLQMVLFLVMAAGLTIAQALFVKGYWLSYSKLMATSLS